MQRYYWIASDPVLGNSIAGFRSVLDVDPLYVVHRGEGWWSLYERYAQDVFPTMEWVMEYSPRLKHLQLFPIDRQRPDVVVVSHLVRNTAYYGWQGKNSNWLLDGPASQIWNGVANWLAFRPNVFVAEVPSKLIQPESEKNKGVIEFVSALAENCKEKGYATTYFVTSPHLHGNPERTQKVFLILWRAEVAPMIPEKNHNKVTKTLTDFFGKAKKNSFFNDPYVVYFREQLQEEPLPDEGASPNLLDRLVDGGIVRDFLHWVNDWAKTPQDKAFARDIDQFVYGHNPVNNAPHVLSFVTDNTLPKHFFRLIHPTANRLCTPWEISDLLGWYLDVRDNPYSNNEGFVLTSLKDNLGRASVNTWKAVAQVIKRVLDADEPIFQSDTHLYMYDNIKGQRFVLQPEPRQRGQRKRVKL